MPPKKAVRPSKKKAAASDEEDQEQQPKPVSKRTKRLMKQKQRMGEKAELTPFPDDPPNSEEELEAPLYDPNLAAIAGDGDGPGTAKAPREEQPPRDDEEQRPRDDEEQPPRDVEEQPPPADDHQQPTGAIDPRHQIDVLQALREYAAEQEAAEQAGLGTSSSKSAGK